MTNANIPRMFYQNVEFKPGDLLLFEWDNDMTKGKVEWVFPIDNNWDKYAEAIDYSDLDGLGFYIDGEENIFPDKITVLEPGTTTIDTTNLKPADYKNFQEGQTIVIKAPECLAEITLNEYSFDQYYPAEGDYIIDGANMSFGLAPNDDSQLLGQRGQ